MLFAMLRWKLVLTFNSKMKCSFLFSLQKSFYNKKANLDQFPLTFCLTLEALRMISIKFLLVISMLCKTEWSWELRTWSHKMYLLDILSTSPHYFCRKWIGATNENSNFDLRVERVKLLLAQQKGSSKMTVDGGWEVENWDEKPFF